jgi:hypothetical protein
VVGRRPPDRYEVVNNSPPEAANRASLLNRFWTVTYRGQIEHHCHTEEGAKAWADEKNALLDIAIEKKKATPHIMAVMAWCPAKQEEVEVVIDALHLSNFSVSHDVYGEDTGCAFSSEFHWPCPCGVTHRVDISY